jgi:hypothetical protein
MHRDRILVTADPFELRPGDAGVVDVYDALNRQFYWADTVIVAPTGDGWDDDEEVLEGEVVG